MALTINLLITGTDNAIWRRIRLVPFEVTIPESERDKNLFQNLKNEAEGIFAWAVQGCILWRKHGLGEPEEVRTATDNYREEMDTQAEFIKDRCVLRPDAKISRKELFDAYAAWCQENGQVQAGSRAFVSGIRDKGFHGVQDRTERCTWMGGDRAGYCYSHQSLFVTGMRFFL